MPGFLDSRAPSIDAEVIRYLDADILGKMVFKNFLLNVVRLPTSQFRIPLSRNGDYEFPGTSIPDAMVFVGGKWLRVEIKCARLNIMNRYRGGRKENWMFSYLTQTRKEQQKQRTQAWKPGTERRKRYDLAFCVGVHMLGFENPEAWNHLSDFLRMRGHDSDFMVRPHERRFLQRCCVFAIPFELVEKNTIRINVSSVPNSKYCRFHAWGDDPKRCLHIWKSAIRVAARRKRT